MIVRIGIALTVGVTALTGCTSGGSTPPTSLPSLTSPAEASESATSSLSPTPPEEAYEHTPAGAAAFVRFYIELINNAYSTGDSEPLRHYATDECDSCSSIADAVDDIYADGGRASGGTLTINSITPSGIAEDVQTSVVVDASTSALELLHSSGQIASTIPGRQGTLFFGLEKDGPSWRIRSIRDQVS